MPMIGEKDTLFKDPEPPKTIPYLAARTYINHMGATRRQLGRSLIYIKKSKRPRMLPCGTPQLTVLAVDRLPFT